MKTLIGALTVGAFLVGASSLSWAADVRHMQRTMTQSGYA